MNVQLESQIEYDNFKYKHNFKSLRNDKKAPQLITTKERMIYFFYFLFNLHMNYQ